MEQLGESYLYAFGWDKKFCDAIEEFFDGQQTKNFQRSEYPPVILHLMRTFYNEDCSKVTFQLLHYCFQIETHLTHPFKTHVFKIKLTRFDFAEMAMLVDAVMS